MQITEVKRHLDGRVERFRCRLMLRRPHLAVLRFDHAHTRRAGGFIFPRGSRSFGFFWPRRPYVLYRMENPRGQLIAHRFDVVEGVRLGEEEVSYTDLLLDLWIDPTGEARVEDEDEVDDHARRRLLSIERRHRIDRTRGLLLRRYTAIVKEAAGLLHAAGVAG